MNFKQALQRLLNKKKIRRKCWEEGHYWVLNEKEQLVNSIGESPIINAFQLRDIELKLINNKRDGNK